MRGNARRRTLPRARRSLCIGIPARDEEGAIAGAIASAHEALAVLGVPGEVVVACSACTDGTSRIAQQAGAVVIDAPAGKGRAVAALVRRLRADVLCLVDADIEYFGAEPLAATVARPVVDGAADAALAAMYWRPVYPRMWGLGFFAPLMGRLYPEAVAALGPTPWSGQRAAIDALWSSTALPAGFAVETALNLAWASSDRRVVSVPVDDWRNARRPKPTPMRDELELILDAAAADGRLEARRDAYRAWLGAMQEEMARYLPDADDIGRFEARLLDLARSTLPQRSPVASETSR